MPYKYISFSTEGVYESIGRRWADNMERLGIDFYIENLPLPDQKQMSDSYFKRYIGRIIRVDFILNQLEYLHQPIVWMDCDDSLISNPNIPENGFDFGYVSNPTNAKTRLPFLAGYLVFHPTPAAFHFLRVWKYLCEWDELEPMGGNHIRLIHTYNIMIDREARKYYNFRPIDLTRNVFPYWRMDGNRQ